MEKVENRKENVENSKENVESTIDKHCQNSQQIREMKLQTRAKMWEFKEEVLSEKQLKKCEKSVKILSNFVESK